MDKDLILYFLKYDLEWLIPAGYENQIQEVKDEYL